MKSQLKQAKKNTKANLNSVSLSSGSGDNKVEKRINVEAIENGFLICKTTEGRVKGDWKYETKKWFSATNPLEINTEDKSLADLFD